MSNGGGESRTNASFAKGVKPGIRDACVALAERRSDAADRAPCKGRPRERTGGFAALAFALTIIAATPQPIDPRKSGTHYLGESTKALQSSDAENPAMLWVQSGEALFNTQQGETNKSCVDCHSGKERSLKGVAASYPRFDNDAKRAVNLSMRINLCRVKHQRAASYAPESRELVSLETYVAHQSRGHAIAPWRDPRMSQAFINGERTFNTRIGQLDLSCADCHDKQAGKRLAGNVIPQAHPTAYPLYRLEWQAVGTLPRRIRNCMSGVRAEPFARGSTEMIELETYLMSRASGMMIETPGVRP
ncbi:MAG: sulfur oxidation c-type cytochrome SoxA [Betaproteobacteria bacterium]|nr:sulfur oxidation c-type cytochrome SoxA [Betaproteobacteria bacterium]